MWHALETKTNGAHLPNPMTHTINSGYAPILCHTTNSLFKNILTIGILSETDAKCILKMFCNILVLKSWTNVLCEEQQLMYFNRFEKNNHIFLLEKNVEYQYHLGAAEESIGDSCVSTVSKHSALALWLFSPTPVSHELLNLLPGPCTRNALHACKQHKRHITTKISSKL